MDAIFIFPIAAIFGSTSKDNVLLGQHKQVFAFRTFPLYSHSQRGKKDSLRFSRLPHRDWTAGNFHNGVDAAKSQWPLHLVDRWPFPEHRLLGF